MEFLISVSSCSHEVANRQAIRIDNKTYIICLHFGLHEEA
jgi:hypothetical protein